MKWAYVLSFSYVYCIWNALSSVNPTSHDVQRYHSDLSNDELETLMGDADTLKGDDFKAYIASNETGPRYGEDAPTIVIQIVNSKY